LELFYDFNGEEIPTMRDGSGLAEAMLGLDRVRVTNAVEGDGEVTIEVETTEAFAWWFSWDSTGASKHQDGIADRRRRLYRPRRRNGRTHHSASLVIAV